MGLIAYLIFGAIVGWVASIVTKREGSYGLVGNILIGVLGALVGSVLYHLISGDETWGEVSLEAFVVSVLGAGLVLWVADRANR